MDAVDTFNHELCAFLDASPTPFHATEQMKQHLLTAGYTLLNEADEWQLETGKGYIVTRNDSSIIAFRLGNNPINEGIRMVGAHTDSPCLKVKPNAVIEKHGYWQLGVEVYGGALLAPWFDRDLSLAGRISYQDSDGQLQHTLINFEEAIAFIPSLAIHLHRGVNDGHAINAQNELPPVVMQADAGVQTFDVILKDQINKQGEVRDCHAIIDFELYFYATDKARIIGLQKDFLASARLDNLLSCFIGLKSLLNNTADYSTLLVCTDHEEVGSASACGAQGPFLESVLQRISNDSATQLTRMLDASLMISVDNAHAIHPNYADKHDSNHGPLLNSGAVIKVNANQRYATNSETSAIFKLLAAQAKQPVQTFVTRSDMGCGSTIGPITSSEIGVRTVDIGVPQWGMHSIRELAGSRDAYSLSKILTEFWAKDRV